MEETGRSPAARHLAQSNPGHMHRGHDLWNISLKFAPKADRTLFEITTRETCGLFAIRGAGDNEISRCRVGVPRRPG
jgi:hypothetical protein